MNAACAAVPLPPPAGRAGLMPPPASGSSPFGGPAESSRLIERAPSPWEPQNRRVKMYGRHREERLVTNRVDELAGGRAVPVVLIVGPADSGRGTLLTRAADHATALGFEPLALRATGASETPGYPIRYALFLRNASPMRKFVWKVRFGGGLAGVEAQERMDPATDIATLLHTAAARAVRGRWWHRVAAWAGRSGWDAAGRWAARRTRPLMMTAENLHQLDGKVRDAVYAGLRSCAEDGIPVGLFGTGLPSVADHPLARDGSIRHERIPVAELTADAATLMLTQPAEATGLALGDGTVELIKARSNRMPGELARYAHEIWRAARVAPVPPHKAARLMDDVDARLHDDVFRSAWRDMKPLERKAMTVCAENASYDGIRRAVGDDPALPATLDRLIHAGLLLRRRGTYSVPSGAMANWIRTLDDADRLLPA